MILIDDFDLYRVGMNIRLRIGWLVDFIRNLIRWMDGSVGGWIWRSNGSDGWMDKWKETCK